MSTTFVVRLRVALPDEIARHLPTYEGAPADARAVITVNRLVDADRASQVRDHLLADGTVTIERASTQECVDLGKAGVSIEALRVEQAGAGDQGG